MSNNTLKSNNIEGVKKGGYVKKIITVRDAIRRYRCQTLA